MNVIVEHVIDLSENEVIVRYNKMSDEIRDLINHLESYDKKLIGVIEKELFVLEPERIFYIECVENRIFIYGKNQVYESKKRLYELENELSEYSFFRASKSLILNINKVQSVRPLFDGRFEARLINNEKVYISRKYVPVLKAKLGL